MIQKNKLFIAFIIIVLSHTASIAQNNRVTKETVTLTPWVNQNNLPTDVKYTNLKLSPSERAKDVIKHMTFEEKLRLTGGVKGKYFPGIPGLGLRSVLMSDASQGVHLNGKIPGQVSTSFPGMLALAATWDPKLAKTFGEKMGEECRALGIDILLGPGINMYRTSEGGRNYEYMGEDPYLTSEIACNYIQGLQSKKVIAVAKHLIANDQEFCRHMMSSDVDERALREIYLSPWEAVIKKAGVKGVMAGNNLLNGIPNSMNKPLLADVLRKEYGFSGIAMTDWQNTIYHPDKQNLVLNSGISLLMPTNETFTNYLSTYLENNPSKKAAVERELDQMVYDNLLPLFEMGVYDRQAVDSTYLPTIKEHKSFARKCAEEAICLLKNENQILPVPSEKKILMMGAPETYCGKGSGFVKGFNHTDFDSGMQEVYGQNFKCIAKPSDDEIKNADIVLYRLDKPAGEGEDIPFYEPAEINAGINHCTSLNHNVVVIITASNGLDMPWLPKVKGVLYTYFLGQERGNALADIISGKVNPSGHLPFTIEKKFEDSPDPEFNYLGGKPYWHGDNSYYKDYWLGKQNAKIPEFAPFVKPGEVIHKTYKEGIFIGYRWYERNKIAVSFPFGFGLSYTTFKYNGIKLSSTSVSGTDSLKVQCSISNSGPLAGAEVVQLYVHDNDASVERPVKELKGFKKIFLQPGETKQVDFVINREDLSFWDIKSHDWKAEKGKFNVLIGSSSADIKMTAEFNLLK